MKKKYNDTNLYVHLHVYSVLTRLVSQCFTCIKVKKIS